MALNLLKVLDHIRVTNPLEDDHIETLMNLATNEVERIASGAPESVKDQSSLLWIAWSYSQRGDETAVPPNSWQKCGALSLLKPWRKIRAGRIQESSE